MLPVVLRVQGCAGENQEARGVKGQAILGGVGGS